jgi:2-polyprenyl-3-methyl-5-hydroxy-6-metoxy-1,4-benzoquinol methylase
MAYAYEDMKRPDILRMVPPDGRVIGSIGCGTGATEEPLVQEGREVHGVDISPEAVEIASKRLTTMRLVQSGDYHPFADHSLDGLILADVIEHIPQAWDALREFVRAVKPGGWVVISVPNMRNYYGLQEFFIGGDWPEKSAGIFDRTHLQVMSIKRLNRWCAAAGMRVEKWFDKYDPYGPRRYRFFRTLDLATLRLFRSWLMFQLQVRCRVEPAPSK